MFTGIIEHVGKTESLEQSAVGGRLRIRWAEAPEPAAALALGSSIAVNGCCLTVAEIGGDWFRADLSAETLRRTAFAELKPGTRVNLERPLTAGKEFGGHFVQGHVDGVGRVERLKQEGENWWLAVRVPDALGRYIALKGSIAIDGISLTVAGWREGVVEAAIIPFTYAHTNLRERTAGDAVNLECDVLAKYVERLLEARDEAPASRLTVARLVEEGF
jgi:riboflavin synthase